MQGTRDGTRRITIPITGDGEYAVEIASLPELHGNSGSLPRRLRGRERGKETLGDNHSRAQVPPLGAPYWEVSVVGGIRLVTAVAEFYVRRAGADDKGILLLLGKKQPFRHSVVRARLHIGNDGLESKNVSGAVKGNRKLLLFVLFSFSLYIMILGFKEKGGDPTRQRRGRWKVFTGGFIGPTLSCQCARSLSSFGLILIITDSGFVCVQGF